MAGTGAGFCSGGLRDLPFSAVLGGAGAGEADCLLNLLGDRDRVLDLSYHFISPSNDIADLVDLSTVGGLEATEAGLDLRRGCPMASLCLALLANVVPVGPVDLDLG